MPVSPCRKRFFTFSARQDVGVFVFGPGGQESIAPQGTLLSAPQESSAQAQLQPQGGQPTARPEQTTAVLFSSIAASFVSTSSTLNAIPSSVTISTAPAAYTPVVSSVTLPTSTFTPISSLPSTSESPPSQAIPSVSIATGSNASNENSDASIRSVPFYVGIVLGVIVVVSCLAAVIAWWVRLSSRSKRRRRDFVDIYVPWCNPRNDEELEDNYRPSNRETPRNDGLQSWDFTADRDVGEPRSSSFFASPTSPVKRALVPHYAEKSHYSGVTHADITHNYPLADSVAFPFPPAYIVTRPIPNQQGSCDSDIQKSAQSLGPLQVANMMPGDVAPSRSETIMDMADSGEFGIPARDSYTGLKPRFWSLNGDGLEVPWAPSQRDPKELTSTSRAEQAHPVGQEPTSGRNANNYSRTSGEGWTASLRQNLEKVLNLVANNITSGVQQQDHLTPAPRRIGQRQSLHGAGWGEHIDGRLMKRSLRREVTVSSASSKIPKAWILEETGDGVGVVHFSSMEKYGFCNNALSSPVSEYTASDDANHNRPCNSDFNVTSQAILNLAKSRPSARLGSTIRNQLYRRPLSFVSRASSVYSTASAISSICSKEHSLCASQLGSTASTNTAHLRIGKAERTTRSPEQRRMRRENMALYTSS